MVILMKVKNIDAPLSSKNFFYPVLTLAIDGVVS